MHDPWIERITATIDGQLDPPGEQALRRHLAECDECRAIAIELRNVVDAAQGAGVAEPARDLWPGIAAAIAADSAVDSAAAGTAAVARPVTRVTPLHGRRAQAGRRFSFTLPQLAAAAVVLMALSGTAVWLAAGRPDTASARAGTIIQSSGSTQLASTTPAPVASPEYTQDVADLEQALEQNRGQLDPATVEVIERSLESIDLAIEDARSALAADPGNPYLHRQLDNTMRKKIDVLRRATGASRARS